MQASISLAWLETLSPFAVLFAMDPVNTFQQFLASRDEVLADVRLNTLARLVCGDGLQMHSSARKFASNLFGRKHDLATLADGSEPAATAAADTVVRTGASAGGDGVPTLEEIGSCLRVFTAAHNALERLPADFTLGWLAFDLKPFRATLQARATSWRYTFGRYVLHIAEEAIQRLASHLDHTDAGIRELQASGDDIAFMQVLGFFHDVGARQEEIEAKLGPLHRTLEMMQSHSLRIRPELEEVFHHLRARMAQVGKKLEDVKRGLAPRIAKEGTRIKGQLLAFDEKLRRTHGEIAASRAFAWEVAPPTAKQLVLGHTAAVDALEQEARDLNQLQQLTGLAVVDFSILALAKSSLIQLDEILALRQYVDEELKGYLQQVWSEVDLEAFEAAVQGKLKLVQDMPPAAQSWSVVQGLHAQLVNMLTAMPSLRSLDSDNLQSRHWKKLFRDAGCEDVLDDTEVRRWSLAQMLNWLPTDQHTLVTDIVEQAASDLNSETSLKVDSSRPFHFAFALARVGAREGNRRVGFCLQLRRAHTLC
jgi:hypothetical protein